MTDAKAGELYGQQKLESNRDDTGELRMVGTGSMPGLQQSAVSEWVTGPRVYHRARTASLHKARISSQRDSALLLLLNPESDAAFEGWSR